MKPAIAFLAILAAGVDLQPVAPQHVPTRAKAAPAAPSAGLPLTLTLHDAAGRTRVLTATWAPGSLTYDGVTQTILLTVVTDQLMCSGFEVQQ